MVQRASGGLIGAGPPVTQSQPVDLHPARGPWPQGQMLTDCLAWRELKLVHNFACHDRRIRGSARRRLRNSV